MKSTTFTHYILALARCEISSYLIGICHKKQRPIVISWEQICIAHL